MPPTHYTEITSRGLLQLSGNNIYKMERENVYCKGDRELKTFPF